MNEHIKQCILDAGFPKFDKMYVVSDGEELEKFAELIVQECMEQLNISNVPAPISAGLNLGKVAIKEHFGVKE